MGSTLPGVVPKQRAWKDPASLRFAFAFVFFLLVLPLTAACGDGSDQQPSELPESSLTPTSAAGRGTTPVEKERLIRDDSPVFGPMDAPVTMVEFLDPECESCRAAFPVVEKLLDEYPEDLRLVVRYFPLHGNSVLAAQATEAAGEQGKYAEMQAILFERQPEWGEKRGSQEDLFVEYAEELGLDIGKFTAALADPGYLEKVNRDRADGIALGVTGTPTFFINGQWVTQPGYAALKSAIDQALE